MMMELRWGKDCGRWGWSKSGSQCHNSGLQSHIKEIWLHPIGCGEPLKDWKQGGLWSDFHVRKMTLKVKQSFDWMLSSSRCKRWLEWQGHGKKRKGKGYLHCNIKRTYVIGCRELRRISDNFHISGLCYWNIRGKAHLKGTCLRFLKMEKDKSVNLLVSIYWKFSMC